MPTTTLLPHFNNFIAKEIETGKFNSEQEVIQAALALLEQKELSWQQLGLELKAGEESGEPTVFNVDEFLNEMKLKYVK
jgi:antitoxin ParD1/3/4